MLNFQNSNILTVSVVKRHIFASSCQISRRLSIHCLPLSSRIFKNLNFNNQPAVRDQFASPCQISWIYECQIFVHTHVTYTQTRDNSIYCVIITYILKQNDIFMENFNKIVIVFILKICRYSENIIYHKAIWKFSTLLLKYLYWL